MQEQGKKKQKLAFIFLNLFLDFYDAIDQQDPSGIDMTKFTGTDIPQEVSLPEKHVILVSNFFQLSHLMLKEFIISQK